MEPTTAGTCETASKFLENAIDSYDLSTAKGGAIAKAMMKYMLKPPITGCADDSAPVTAGLNGIANGLDQCATTLAVNGEVGGIFGGSGFAASLETCNNQIMTSLSSSGPGGTSAFQTATIGATENGIVVEGTVGAAALAFYAPPFLRSVFEVPIRWATLTYHLFLPAKWIEAGRVFNPEMQYPLNFVAHYPKHQELLLTTTMAVALVPVVIHSGICAGRGTRAAHMLRPMTTRPASE